MAPAKGNKHAEKWTKDEVEQLLYDMNITAREEDCYYIGDLLVKYNLYREIWSYWKDKFKDDEDVFQSIKKIEQVFEAKLYSGALNAKFNPALAIFGLKNNHKWTDKIETDITTKGESMNKVQDLSKLTNEELKQMAAIQKKLND